MTVTLERGPIPATPAPNRPRRRWASALRWAGGAAILGVLVWRVGTGPIIDGLRTVSVGSIAAAVAICAVTTAAAAWRWTLVARGLGVAVAWLAAFAAYYRSQFLNTTLPGGVLGDVHRGVRHGRAAGDVGRGLRAVAWERGAGQVVQVVLAVVVLLTMASPVRAAMPFVVVLAVAGGLVAALALRALPQRGASRRARALRAIRDDLRHGVLARRTWPGITVASVIVVAGHALIFVVAARTAGSNASVAQLLPIAMLVLLAMSVPTNIGGWGPREGAAAWLFAAAGLGAGAGVAAATVYGVLGLVASLPGAGVLVGAWFGRRPARAGARVAADE